ncbi:MAG: hypothetical protein ABIR79_15560 [Candidatus Binatia bacterium]
MIALFLAAHAVCVCATSAVASVATARSHAARVVGDGAPDPHACCHPDADAPAHRDSAPPCLHCSHGALATADATLQLAPPTLVAAPIFLLPERSLPRAEAWGHRRLSDPGGSIAALLVLAYTSVLRL